MNGMFGTLFKIVAAGGITYVIVIKVLGLFPSVSIAALVGFYFAGALSSLVILSAQLKPDLVPIQEYRARQRRKRACNERHCRNGWNK